MIKAHEAQGYEVIFVDEVIFTSSCNHSKTWAKQKKPITIEQRQTTMTPIAVVAAISASRGVELVSQFDHSVDKYKFESCLVQLRERNPNKKICVFLDNLAVHKSKVVTDRAAKLQIPMIFNCPYFPEGNPIELVFAQSKREYKKSKLQKIVMNKKLYQKVLIKNSFSNASKEFINKCIKHSKKVMELTIDGSLVS